MRIPPEIWAEIRRLYCEEGWEPRELSERFGMTARTIRAHAKAETWKRAGKRAPGERAGSDPGRSKNAPAARDSAEVFIQRLYGAINMKLEHMENRMASGKPRSAADEERESRAIGTMIRNFEKVTEVAAGFDRSREREGCAASPGSTDAERMRREIAERLERLNRERRSLRGSRIAERD